MISDADHMANGHSATNDRVVTSHSQYYSSREVWFRAAVIAVPITGSVILVLLVLVALRMLKSDAAQQLPLKRAPSFTAHAPLTNYNLLRMDESLKSVVTVDDDACRDGVTSYESASDELQQVRASPAQTPHLTRVRHKNVTCKQNTCSLAQHRRHSTSRDHNDLDTSSQQKQQQCASKRDEPCSSDVKTTISSQQSCSSALLPVTDELCTSAHALCTHDALCEATSNLLKNDCVVAVLNERMDNIFCM